MAERRITVLVENTAGKCGLLGEHGLSFWIELGESKILFDTGQGSVLARNAEKLDVDLKKTDAILLSHGHYDHTGGLGDVLRPEKRTKIYAHPEAFNPKFARNSDGSARYIGMSPRNKRMVNECSELILTEAPSEVCNGLFLTGSVPRVTDFENTGGDFFEDTACRLPDELPDDQAVFIETSDGTIVVLGCAHAGVINTLRYIQTLTNNRPIHTVMGGMHLLNASPERMDKTVVELRRLDIQRLLPCHCTGQTAVVRLWNEFPGQCQICRVGTII